MLIVSSVKCLSESVTMVAGQPAAAEGLTVEGAPTSRLVDEVTGAPGGLLRLSHVLLETWQRRRGKPTMTRTEEVLEAFAPARLLTLDGDTAELAREALLTAWPRLRDWIERERERLRVHRKLTDAAGAWGRASMSSQGLDTVLS